MLPCYLKIHFKMKYCLSGTLVKLLLPRKIEMSWIEFPWCCQFPSSSLSGTCAHRMKGQCLPCLLNSWEPRDFCRQEEHTHFSSMPSYHPGTSLFSKQRAVTFPRETSFAWVLFFLFAVQPQVSSPNRVWACETALPHWTVSPARMPYLCACGLSLWEMR